MQLSQVAALFCEGLRCCPVAEHTVSGYNATGLAAEPEAGEYHARRGVDYGGRRGHAP
jgi:hypothetical protein